MKTDNKATSEPTFVGSMNLHLVFTDLKTAVQRKFNSLKNQTVFQAKIDRDRIWELYLESFPEGTNPIFRERTEHDCSCCRSFVKNAGGMVWIQNGELVSLWDVGLDGPYGEVCKALSDYVKSCGIENVFLSTESTIGTDKNREQIDQKIQTWEHFHLKLEPQMVSTGRDYGSSLSEYRARYDVLKRGLSEIQIHAIETVRDLIQQNSLYRGEEKKKLVDEFLKLKKAFDQTPSSQHDLFVWNQVNGPNSWLCKARNDVIGTLMVDLSEGVDLEVAVKKFEDKVSGTNYQRPTALITPRMKEQARQAIIDLDLMSSLERRYAGLTDITINNLLFANRDTRKVVGGDIFDTVPTKGTSSQKLGKVEEVSIEKFIEDILPTATSVEVLLENKHEKNLVSLIAPCDLTAKPLFKWNNLFSWSYNNHVADSIADRVKAAGGNIDAEVCCRLAWYNTDDLDLHMKEPRGEIYYGSKRSNLTGGELDVDMNVGSKLSTKPVENIFYAKKSDMVPGTYTLFVNQFRSRNNNDVGFEVEISLGGEIHTFSHDKRMSNGSNVEVAKFEVSQSREITLKGSLKSESASKELWGLQSQNFHPVTAIMLSPNHWNGEGVGNKHFFFMLQGCENPGQARGFYNEFLRAELSPHRKTMEIVGSKARTEETENQMSGIGFSSTQRSEVIVRVEGSFTRMIKVLF